MSFSKVVVALWTTFLFEIVSGAQVRLGVLVTKIPDLEQSMCIRYYPELYNLSSHVNEAAKFKLKDLADLADVNTCLEDNPDLDKVRGKLGYVVAKDSNCSVADRALILEEYQSLGMITHPNVSSKFNVTTPSKNLVVTLHLERDAERLMELKDSHPDHHFILYGLEDFGRGFDGSILIIFCMAVFTVAVGSLWSGYNKQSIRQAQISRRLSSRESTDGNRPSNASPGSSQEKHSQGVQEEDVSVFITPVWVLVFVLCMCIMLVLLYLFFDYLVYVIIGMFVLASVLATYACLEPIVLWSYRALPWCPTLTFPRCNLLLCTLNLELRQFILLSISITLGVIWAVYRNSDWAWILQDLLGIAFSINMLKTLRLPSFKICTILMSVLFFYDIFFVFLTPFLTKDGKSIMVEVATGGDTGEQLPMVLKVPHLNRSPEAACFFGYSMLGYGDILVPGLLLSYCHAFDLLKETPGKIYWVVSNVCYALSLLICFVALFLMNYAQPALLYIVPCTLIPIALLAYFRGELKELWLGDTPPDPVGPASPSRSEDRKGSTVDEETGESPEDQGGAVASGSTDDAITTATAKKSKDDAEKLLD